MKIRAGPALKAGGAIVRIDGRGDARIERRGNQAEPREDAKLVVCEVSRISVGAVPLRGIESAGGPTPAIVTTETVGPAQEFPPLAPLTTGGRRVANGEDAPGAILGDQFRVASFLVPLVGVCPPALGVAVQNLGLDPPPALRLALLHFQRERLGDYGVGRQRPRGVGIRSNPDL